MCKKVVIIYFKIIYIQNMDKKQIKIVLLAVFFGNVKQHENQFNLMFDRSSCDINVSSDLHNNEIDNNYIDANFDSAKSKNLEKLVKNIVDTVVVSEKLEKNTKENIHVKVGFSKNNTANEFKPDPINKIIKYKLKEDNKKTQACQNDNFNNINSQITAFSNKRYKESEMKNIFDGKEYVDEQNRKRSFGAVNEKESMNISCSGASENNKQSYMENNINKTICRGSRNIIMNPKITDEEFETRFCSNEHTNDFRRKKLGDGCSIDDYNFSNIRNSSSDKENNDSRQISNRNDDQTIKDSRYEIEMNLNDDNYFSKPIELGKIDGHLINDSNKPYEYYEDHTHETSSDCKSNYYGVNNTENIPKNLKNRIEKNKKSFYNTEDESYNQMNNSFEPTRKSQYMYKDRYTYSKNSRDDPKRGRNTQFEANLNDENMYTNFFFAGNTNLDIDSTVSAKDGRSYTENCSNTDKNVKEETANSFKFVNSQMESQKPVQNYNSMNLYQKENFSQKNKNYTSQANETYQQPQSEFRHKYIHNSDLLINKSSDNSLNQSYNRSVPFSDLNPSISNFQKYDYPRNQQFYRSYINSQQSDDPEVKNLLKKERNRMAAKKSREKKTNYMRELEMKTKYFEKRLEILEISLLDYDLITNEIFKFVEKIFYNTGSLDDNAFNLFDFFYKLRFVPNDKGFYVHNIDDLFINKHFCLDNKRIDKLVGHLRQFLCDRKFDNNYHPL
ncbi:hypothetical protein EDEG_05081 [Edhazardia aedis USNM 41457]|uniref:BZIP domain-containing protein n=1 Tax=Edhazardia aedis (strain USNM 41457) TaxID=1003232 RepID=A0A0L1P6D6_EDHAE|nr:hypothetical protein EDEG_05081 [Edhazardia aedis USNM 41457]|eukprot:KNH48537.1 hypothetical protein EDEG_05081 [Edhazardia aedis USNM 41457]